MGKEAGRPEGGTRGIPKDPQATFVLKWHKRWRSQSLAPGRGTRVGKGSWGAGGSSQLGFRHSRKDE